MACMRPHGGTLFFFGSHRTTTNKHVEQTPHSLIFSRALPTRRRTDSARAGAGTAKQATQSELVSLGRDPGHPIACPQAGMPWTSTDAPHSVVCRCLSNASATTDPENVGLYLAHGLDPALKSTHLRKWCSKPDYLAHCYPSSSPVPSPPLVPLGSTRRESIAWCITGGLRSFFAPIVHESLLRHGILAFGGEPRVFFAATLADDAKPGRKSISAGGADGAANNRSCARLHANLSAFLSAHEEWARVTAFVSEERAARPHMEHLTTAIQSPECSLPKEVADAFAQPHYVAQMVRWHEVFLAVQRDEVARDRRFDYVARLRFDVALGAPLPLSLLRPDRAAVAYPVTAKNFFRGIPLPDHFWVLPRAHASTVFEIVHRVKRWCSSRESGTVVNAGAVKSGSLPSNTTFGAAAGDARLQRACAATALCDDQPGMAIAEHHYLCCGGGPTGLLVRALHNLEARLRAERERHVHYGATRTGAHAPGHAQHSVGAHYAAGAGLATRSVDASPRPPLPPMLPPPFQLILAELPMMLVGDEVLANVKCSGRRGHKPGAAYGDIASSQWGYFTDKTSYMQDCVAVTSACSAPAARPR